MARTAQLVRAEEIQFSHTSQNFEQTIAPCFRASVQCHAT